MLETTEAANHYSEKPLLLPHPPVAFHKPVFQPVQPLVLPEGNLYLCPTTLYKIHPDFDQVLAGILALDPLAQVLFVCDPYRPLHHLLQQRWQKSVATGHERLHFLPWSPPEVFYQLLTQVRVILDPPHFGMGTTAYLALAAATPVVTWPAPFLRGRSAAGLCQYVGRTEGLVARLEDYPQRACLLAHDPQYRLLFQQNRDHLFEQTVGVQALWDVWEKTGRPQRG